MIEDTLNVQTTTSKDALLQCPQDVLDWLAARVPPRCKVMGVSLFCVRENRSQILSLIDIAGVSANAAALALDGQPFGFSSVVVTIRVGPNFRCRQRDADGSLPDHCACTPALHRSALLTEFD
jgi:hypothetical protein